MEAYCLKCKEKREINEPNAEFTITGRPITKGICSVCGGKVSLIGKTPAHEGLTPPPVEAVKAESAAKKTSATSSSKTKPSKTSATSTSKTKLSKTGATSTSKTKTTKTGATSTSKTKPTKTSATSTGKTKTTKNSATSTSKTKTTKASAQKNYSIGGADKLVIVESPAKARTVGRFLGKEYAVRASVGHVRDLNTYGLSIDIEHGFEPKYVVSKDKKEIVNELTQLSAQAKKIYLATDPDREGEAIAWHLYETANMTPEKTARVVFHEITKPAIENAFAHPGAINMDLVDSQQARRVMDRLLGYPLSNLMSSKVRSRLTAGRVQSVAVRLIVEREREIEAFVPQEYWDISAELIPDGKKDVSFIAKLAKIDGKDPVLSNQMMVDEHIALLEKASYAISAIKDGTRKKRPSAPFTTSTLQQEASKKLNFYASKTMSTAQRLYEGIDIGADGTTGLITYMRTDSTNISEQAQKEARDYIEGVHGKSYLPKSAPQYKTKAKGAQEAHEAIRPTSVFNTPDKIRQYLDNDQYKLYQLIWKRFVASQMEDALYQTKTIEVKAENQNLYLFRASGSTLKFPGFLAVYEEEKDEDAKEEINTRFPDGLFEGQAQNLKRLIPEQHFTQPPARYTEATLVKAMEEYGIGRPSTYASILSKIRDRDYTYLEAKRFYPTDVGKTATDLLTASFPRFINVEFTSVFEEDLDKVADGERNWRDVVGEFYAGFDAALTVAKENMPVVKPEPQKIGRACPECGKDLVIRIGRFGQFISCSGYPECKHTEAILQKIGVACPECGGDLVARRAKKGGRAFYGCSNYPECQYATWKKPLPQKCDACGGMMVAEGKDKALCTQCGKTTDIENVE